MKNIIFVRIGWMKYYAGSQPGDERPIGGGKYNRKNIGDEVDAFKDRKGWLYGGFAFKATNDGLNLKRINPKVKGESISHVQVIFFARDRFSGWKHQVLIGWYNNATVYNWQRGKPVSHIAKARTNNSVLLPSEHRTLQIPRGKKAPGQANTFFVYSRSGKRRKSPWIDEVLKFIKSYRGQNLLRHPEVEIENEIESNRENALETTLGQGVMIDTSARKVIENLAMEAAKKYYKNKGYKVENVSGSQSYDLKCIKGKKCLKVEVKGTQGTLSNILLTPKEVNLGRSGEEMEMFIKHSIVLKKRRKLVTAYGGRNTVIKPWKIDNKRLRVIAYSYKLD